MVSLPPAIPTNIQLSLGIPPYQPPWLIKPHCPPGILGLDSEPLLALIQNSIVQLLPKLNAELASTLKKSC